MSKTLVIYILVYKVIRANIGFIYETSGFNSK